MCVCVSVGVWVGGFRLEIKGSEPVEIITCVSLPIPSPFVFSWYKLTDHSAYMTVTATRETASSDH